jgi:hypothetical protein
MINENDTVDRLRIWADGMEKQNSVSVSVLMNNAADEILRLRDERDEARREVCMTWEAVTARDSRDVAADKGWDCFKENTDV